ncbi:uncharacterized protein LOC116351348 isoform X2 [Contarinia nasturtii]|uniref:uncharacterized protein LOC116351348 isoform X2 n=1 Tax=Contarinia nasturtii TaxID=265458 RepID=UPI0012D4AF7B|nr:uncharacterized protein LOC116351348 isoform X2 [Contarinia nasturtii]
MLWCEVLFSLFVLIIQLKEVIGAENHKKFTISCVSNNSVTEFTSMSFDYDPLMAIHEYKFNASQLAKVKEIIGNKERIIFFFMGFGDFFRNPSGESFKLAKEEMLSTNSCSCTVSHAFHWGADFLKLLQYFPGLVSVVPRIVLIGTNFIKNIVDSDDFNIKLSTVYLSGYSLGGHISGMIGHRLKEVYNGEMVEAIWAFDPPKVGFSYPSSAGKPRRVQKGDAKFVIVFITSKLGFLGQHLGDIDVIVNNGLQQPECSSDEIGCNHRVALKIREWIIMKDMMYPPVNKSGTYYLHTQKVEENPNYEV